MVRSAKRAADDAAHRRENHAGPALRGLDPSRRAPSERPQDKGKEWGLGLPALLEARRHALVDRALRGLADRAGDGDVVEQLLLGADLAQPFVVGGRQRLAGADAGAGVGDGDLGALVGLVIARDVAADAGDRTRALLVDAVAVLQRQ